MEKSCSKNDTVTGNGEFAEDKNTSYPRFIRETGNGVYK